MAGKPSRRPGTPKRPAAGTKRSKDPVRALTGGRRMRWDMVGAAVVIVALIGVLAYNYVPKYLDQADAQRYSPSAAQPDPSDRIDGVEKKEYPAGKHVAGSQRVAYNQSPPFGGPHDQYWATCTGMAYPQPIRSENAVHSLEHGAVWITYNADLVGERDVAALQAKVKGKPYMLMSPYPGLSAPVTLQSWGRQLEVDSADDKRIDQFITALRQNQNTHPEFGASCSTPGGGFDPNKPPPFDPTPPGPDAVPVEGAAAPAAPAPGTASPEVDGGN
ncbi:DUF3105 domain-containing protein [Nocardia ninae]